MPKGSKWLEWRRALFQSKPTADYLIDDDGTFHCDHGCGSLERHAAMKIVKPSCGPAIVAASMPPEARFLGEVQKLSLAHGDILVFLAKERLRPEQHEFIKSQMAGLFPGHKCLVLENGATIGIISPESAPA